MSRDNYSVDRYQGLPLSPLDMMFAAGRGHQKDGIDVPSLEMVKWFDTNYHYMRPEVSKKTVFKLNLNESNVNPVSMFKEAKEEIGLVTRPVLLGPITFLYLSKVSKCVSVGDGADSNGDSGLEPVDLVHDLVPVYAQLLNLLAREGAEWIQMDEPVLVFDLEPRILSLYHPVYERLKSLIPPSLNLLLTTYFGEIPSENMAVVSTIPVDGVHFDLVRGPDQMEQISSYSKKSQKAISLGLVDGRNVWRNHLAVSMDLLHTLNPLLSCASQLFLSSSSSLLHVPHSLKGETGLDRVTRSWFSFATEKVDEIVTLVKGVNEGSSAIKEEVECNGSIIRSRTESRNDSVQRRMERITDRDLTRSEPFEVRREKQMEWMQLPLFPTTTIGSFPQTDEIRSTRARYIKGDVSEGEYRSFIESQIREVIQFQETTGLDVLVHGESERNDMVQYFGERMDGFVFTLNGWVQSYGSRCVRPPIVVGDVSRPKPMTVTESAYAQSITSKPVKGMLTGPVTIIRWSFPRDDVSQDVQLRQVALAIRDEVADLERAGIKVIQVDEPAVREGLPLRKKDWSEYLNSAVTSFKLATSGVSSQTQIHSHFCYSDFNDIFDSIQALDADVISIEASKSDLKLIQGFKKFGYKAWIGPGVYDIHSPRVPSKDEVIARLQSVLSLLPPQLVWINPDCGLKTRGWKETKASLENLVAAARHLRSQYQK